jgi:hypothetical protein
MANRDDESFRRLVEKLRAAGAKTPERWASSEISKDIPQLARFCFLRSLWPDMIDRWRENTEWVGRSVSNAERDPNDCFADAGVALKRLLALGATRDDLASIARMVAYETAFGVVNRIDEGMDWDYGFGTWISCMGIARDWSRPAANGPVNGRSPRRSPYDGPVRA